MWCVCQLIFGSCQKLTMQICVMETNFVFHLNCSLKWEKRFHASVNSLLLFKNASTLLKLCCWCENSNFACQDPLHACQTAQSVQSSLAAQVQIVIVWIGCLGARKKHSLMQVWNAKSQFFCFQKHQVASEIIFVFEWLLKVLSLSRGLLFVTTAVCFVPWCSQFARLSLTDFATDNSQKLEDFSLWICLHKLLAPWLEQNVCSTWLDFAVCIQNNDNFCDFLSHKTFANEWLIPKFGSLWCELMWFWDHNVFCLVFDRVLSTHKRRGKLFQAHVNSHHISRKNEEKSLNPYKACLPGRPSCCIFGRRKAFV